MDTCTLCGKIQYRPVKDATIDASLHRPLWLGTAVKARSLLTCMVQTRTWQQTQGQTQGLCACFMLNTWRTRLAYTKRITNILLRLRELPSTFRDSCAAVSGLFGSGGPSSASSNVQSRANLNVCNRLLLLSTFRRTMTRIDLPFIDCRAAFHLPSLRLQPKVLYLSHTALWTSTRRRSDYLGTPAGTRYGNKDQVAFESSK